MRSLFLARLFVETIYSHVHIIWKVWPREKMANPEEESQNTAEYDALIEMTEDLYNALPINELLPKMISKRVIDFQEKADIRSERTDRDKVGLFLSKLIGPMTSGENTRFYSFIEVMKGSPKCNFLVHRLQGWISHFKTGTPPPTTSGWNLLK